jgi:hypothetical protein
MRNPMTLMFALATGLAGHVAAAQGPGDQPTLRPLRPETSIPKGRRWKTTVRKKRLVRSRCV